MPKFNFTPTAIGSLPHKDASLACALILQTLEEIPFLPQLPKRSFCEGMITQYIEGIPGIKLDLKAGKVHLDTPSAEKGMELFYENILNQNIEHFTISPDYALGLHKMLETITERSDVTEAKRSGKNIKMKHLKGQITGPITFGLNLADENGKAIIHNEILADMAVKCLTMKALWQVKKIKELKLNPIMFMDEPSLMEYGSAYLPIGKEIIEKQLNEIIDALHAEKALIGLHCCGNTDWGMLLNLPLDIISFDAYSYMEKFALYTKETNKFLSRGGIITWGIVPSTTLENPITTNELSSKLSCGIELLAKKGVKKELILNQSLISPACGLGLLSETESEKRFSVLKNIIIKNNSGLI
ncbi:MAG: hypothetical protein HY811_01710 [Planctomycetes bacterium]|nr:hypothetical protein [Planctomycetota bacterium]